MLPHMPEPHEEPQVNVPHREIRDPHVLRAMAHPLRLAILEELARLGPATATDLSERVGESAANCSWHLRQLAKYGFIEEAEGGTGRQRPWRLVVRSTRIPVAGDDEPDFAQASDALIDVLLDRELAALRAWLAARRQAPKPWRDGATTTTSWDYLTAEEMQQFRQEFLALLDRWIFAERMDPARRPPHARPVRLVAWMVPADPPSELPADEGG